MGNRKHNHCSLSQEAVEWINGELLGDGCLRGLKNSRPNIKLYTIGFLIKDIEWLVKQLTNLKFKVWRQLSKNSIFISAYSTKEFLNYISPCPVGCYQYKWNYQDNRKGNLILE